jgi:RNA polymerase sigma factor (sigma-70 family)
MPEDKEAKEKKDSEKNSQESKVEAFDALVNRYKGLAYRWAYNRLQDAQLAEDAVQEAFITAYTHLDELKDPAAFPAWFKRIVVTSCNRLTRRKQLATEAYEEDYSGGPSSADPSSDYETQEQEETVKEAVFGLPKHERVVIEMFYFSNYSQQEIAERLAIPITTVKKRLQYAREHLREKMPPMAILVQPMESQLADYQGIIAWLDSTFSVFVIDASIMILINTVQTELADVAG